MLLYSSGYFITFKFVQFQQKQEMKAFVQKNPHSALATQFKFSLQDLEVNKLGFDWEEEGQEFSYKGIMYDVVNFNFTKDSVFIIAIKDYAENQMIDYYLSLMKQQTNKKNTATSLLKLFAFVFVNEITNLTILTKEFSVPHTALYQTFCSIVVIEIIAPPPQV